MDSEELRQNDALTKPEMDRYVPKGYRRSHRVADTRSRKARGRRRYGDISEGKTTGKRQGCRRRTAGGLTLRDCQQYEKLIHFPNRSQRAVAFLVAWNRIWEWKG